ncbi:hypothetical protein MJT46_015421 [Ovis ammon polii x Ovis aries]|nr:hypothetical protein MJT46_015421 [Ovis ammon polii x Ovis aries]
MYVCCYYSGVHSQVSVHCTGTEVTMPGHIKIDFVDLDLFSQWDSQWQGPELLLALWAALVSEMLWNAAVWLLESTFTHENYVLLSRFRGPASELWGPCGKNTALKFISCNESDIVSIHLLSPLCLGGKKKTTAARSNERLYGESELRNNVLGRKQPTVQPMDDNQNH